MTFVIDFDKNTWMPNLEAFLGETLSDRTKNMLRQSNFAYQEDARDALVDSCGKDRVINGTLDWIRNSAVRIFHGTRLTNEEMASLHSTGLRKLNIDERIEKLRSEFPVLRAELLPEITEEILERHTMRPREDGVHAAISRDAMIDGSYEYLFEGSEFDRRLLANTGLEHRIPLVTSRGLPRIVNMVVPGSVALQAMHPRDSIEETWATHGFPNFVQDVLSEYAWELHRPGSARQSTDSCLVFRDGVPASYIEKIETLPDQAGGDV